MVATLQSRKEALEAKILEKNEELKTLCLQEAALTGVMPPEIPLEPGEPPPPIRRRVGTSFLFPQNLINNVKDADDESLTALELEYRVQINIAEAALALANDPSANKAARRKHRLMYRQSQRRLKELETRLNLLKQSKAQQIKKKPRPNTTSENFFWKKNDQNSNYFGGDHLGSWPGKLKPSYSVNDSDRSGEFALQTDAFGSLQRSFKSGATSQSSSSPRTDVSNEEFKIGSHHLINSISFPNNLMSGAVSYMSMQSPEGSKLNLNANAQHPKRITKKGIIKKQWDSQSAGGTLLPSQTYPEHSHQPNLNRTQSLGSVESNVQKSKDSWSVQDLSYEANSGKEKEWYETALDSAPSPPLRTTSRLPSMARMLYQMQELQSKEAGVNWSVPNFSHLLASASHPALSTAANSMPRNYIKTQSNYLPAETRHLVVDNLTNSIQQMQLSSDKKGKASNNAIADDLGILNQKDFLYNTSFNGNQEAFNNPANMPKIAPEHSVSHSEANAKLELIYPSTSTDPRFLQTNDNNVGLPLSRQNSLNQTKFKTTAPESENPIKGTGILSNAVSNGMYMNIPLDAPDGSTKNWLNADDFPIQIKSGQIAVPQEYVPKAQTPTQPYYHTTKHAAGEKIKNLQYQAAKNRHAFMSEEQNSNKAPSPIHVGTHHPPHAITQNEISFDTVVPFESPQNHTVVQAGKWQPYREVTKPFEMSDFYKYSTKFRQNQAQVAQATTDATVNSPNTVHQKGVYTPLKPMTCRPVESLSNQAITTPEMDVQCSKDEKTMVEVSPPEIV